MRITELDDVPSKNLSSPRFHRHFWSASAGRLGAVEASWVAHRAETEGGKKGHFLGERTTKKNWDRGTIRRERVGEPLVERKMGVCSSSAAFSILPFWAYAHCTSKTMGRAGKTAPTFPPFPPTANSTLELLSLDLFPFSSLRRRTPLFSTAILFFFLNNLSLQ